MEMTAKLFNKHKHSFPITECLLLLVAIFWGTSYGLTKSALLYTSVLVFISIRFSMTFLCLLPMVLRDFRLGRNKDWQVALPTGLILSAIFFCEVFGVANTTASNAAFLISLSLLFTAILEALMTPQKLKQWLWLMLLCSISVFGVFLLTGKQSDIFSLNKGDYFILGAALLRAGMVTFTKRFTENKSISTTTLTAIQSFVVASVAILLLIILPDSKMTLPDELAFWLTLIYLVLFCTLFAFYVQNYAVRRTSPTRVALLMGSEPLFGAIFALVWLNESLSLTQIIGAGFILLSVIVTSLQRT
ncbi:DMT family transporter [Marinomonas sp. THO17]|uniref:DMT family transporter n=1 Tax=Marinomonas sp. THO17 TaxID=3149048 RepID=UPI00336BED58